MAVVAAHPTPFDRVPGLRSIECAYLWSDVLATDTEQWMKNHGGLLRANGDLIREKVLSRGRSADVLSMFRDFYGRDRDIGPLLESRGLVLAEPADS